ncbi:hypothetical protein A5721_06310 [Mycobacterium vulneris]|nr:hypothetical protein A5721_06310 [Mycolicibacterium vulneris]
MRVAAEVRRDVDRRVVALGPLVAARLAGAERLAAVDFFGGEVSRASCSPPVLPSPARWLI